MKRLSARRGDLLVFFREFSLIFFSAMKENQPLFQFFMCSFYEQLFDECSKFVKFYALTHILAFFSMHQIQPSSFLWKEEG